MAIPNFFAMEINFGGGGGSPFDDVAGAPRKIVAISSIKIRSGSRVDAIQVNYVLDNGAIYSAPRRGGSGGSERTIEFNSGENIISVSGRSGSRVDQLQFTTRDTAGKTRTHGPYGGGGGSPFVVNGVVGAFFGRNGNELDRIGFYLNGSTTAQYGGNGGSVFSDAALIQNPPVVGFKSITVRHGNEVDAIQATYLRSDGTTYEAPAHGGTGGSATTINFDEGEKIIAAIGRSGQRLDQVTFLAMKATGERNTYGPYGGGGGSAFITNAEVTGFFGRSGEKVDALGFFTESPASPELTIYGSRGYRYCVLTNRDEQKSCIVPVQSGTTDLSFRINVLGNDSTGIGFTVTDPSGRVYDTASDGNGNVWAVGAEDSDHGLQTFYTSNPAVGNWTATVITDFSTDGIDVDWSLIGSTNPNNASPDSKDAFSTLAPSERQAVYDAINTSGDEIPPEICYFCQAQAVAIMGLAVATFVFWAGPVTATSAVVLYAERLLPSSAATIVASINQLYSAWQNGVTSWNLARQFCELEGLCSASANSGTGSS